MSEVTLISLIGLTEAGSKSTLFKDSISDIKKTQNNNIIIKK